MSETDVKPEVKTYDTKKTIIEVQNQILHLGAGTLGAAIRPRMCEIADAAYKNGGCDAVVPALVDEATQWCPNAFEAKLIAFGMLFALAVREQTVEEAHEHTPAPDPDHSVVTDF